MGKVKSKNKASSLDRAKRTAAKTAQKAAKLAAREANLPPGTAPKLRHKDIKKAKLAAASAPTGGIKFEDLVITTAPQRAKEALSHVKWTALFKKHLGVLESHVKALDRVAQHLKSYMSGLPDEERIKWEKGEEGNWGKICGLLDRARDTLCNAREASQGLVAPHYLRDKKGLGVAGINYVPLLPQVEALKAGLTVDKENNGATALGATTTKAEPVDSDGDSEMEDAPEANSDSDSSSSSDSESDSDDEDSAPKKKTEEKTTKPVEEVEPNPYFVVDTEPTPVNLPTSSTILPTKKGKKRAKDEEAVDERVKKVKKSQAIELTPEAKEIKRKEASPEIEPKKSKKAKIEKSVVVEDEKKEVDFHALQAQLQAEVDVGEATKEVEALGESKEAKKERKRRRSSDGLSKEGKKHKKEKSESSRKRKAEDEGESGKKRKA